MDVLLSSIAVLMIIILLIAAIALIAVIIKATIELLKE